MGPSHLHQPPVTAPGSFDCFGTNTSRQPMQRQDDHPTPATSAQPEVPLRNEDCVIMLEAIRQRVAGLAAPLGNGHARAGPRGYQAFATRKELDECAAALGLLLAMVNPQRGGAEQIAQDVAELRNVLSGAHKRL